MSEHDEDALNQDAIARADQGDLEGAETRFRKAAEAGYVPAIYNLGKLLEASGRPREAVDFYGRSASLGEVDGYIAMARVLLDDLGDRERAEESLLTAAQLGYSDAMVNLGLLYERVGSDDLAERWYRTAIEAGDVAAYWPLGGVLEAVGRESEAESAYREAVAAGEQQALVDLAMLFADQGRLEEAESMLRQALDGNVPHSAFYLGEVLDRQGSKAEEAEAMYTRAVEEGDAQAYERLADLRERAGTTGEA